MGQGCAPEQPPCSVDVMFCRCNEMLDGEHDAPIMASRAVVVGARSDRCRLGTKDVWQALANSLAWRADMQSEAWRSLAARHPEVPGDWDLMVFPDMDEAIPGVPLAGAYYLKVLLGNEWSGRSTFSSSMGVEWPPKTGPKLVISGSRFLLSLWPLMVNGIGQQLLYSLTGGRNSDDPDLNIGEDETPEETQSVEFLLAGMVQQQVLKGPLELQVRWTQEGVTQSISLPFETTDDLTDRMTSWKRCQAGCSSRVTL